MLAVKVGKEEEDSGEIWLVSENPVDVCGVAGCGHAGGLGGSGKAVSGRLINWFSRCGK